MTAKLTFLGGAQNVTGSKYLLEVDGARILVDCGLYQERDLVSRNWDAFPIPPSSIDALLLTHAHVDHSGYIPKLVKDGFTGPIYCTQATLEISEIILKDSANLQEEDAAFKKKRHQKEGRKGKFPEVPLYTKEDVASALPLFKAVEYKQPCTISDGVQAFWYDAGHVLGSASIKVIIRDKSGVRSIVFSGDIGGCDRPLLHNPTVFDDADYVVMESTYGDRVREGAKDLDDTLCRIIQETKDAGGNIIIPSFALERAQEVIYHLNELLMKDCIPHLMIFVDSPMATSITEIFRRHPELFDADMRRLLSQDRSPFDIPTLKLVRTVDDSKAINYIKGSVVIIAGAGMCNGGRIKHHLVTNITRPESTILFVGYQAVGTLGRQIVEGNRSVRIFGQTYPVKARVEQLTGFSAHADRNELLQWISGLKRSPKQIFVTHGEPAAAESFARYGHEKTGWNFTIPSYLESVLLK